MPQLSQKIGVSFAVEGAQHGFAVDGDPTYADPQSQAWQAHVIHQVAEWITAGN